MESEITYRGGKKASTGDEAVTTGAGAGGDSSTVVPNGSRGENGSGASASSGALKPTAKSQSKYRWYWYLLLVLLPLLALVLMRRRVANDLTIYDSARWWDEGSSYSILRRMNLVRVPYFLSHFSPDARHVVDVGCGGGFVAEDVARSGKYSVTGFDISKASLAAASEHAQTQALPITYRQGSIYAIPLADESVDAVIVSDVLEHLENIPGALSEVRRVLKPGGVFVFDTISRTAWSFLSTWLVAQEIVGIVEPGAHDWRMFITPTEMETSLNAAGFSCDRSGWAGIGANLSITNAIAKRSLYDVIESFYRDNSDFSASYMGYAVKPL